MSGWVVPSDGVLWAGLNAHMFAVFGGHVGVVKMLKAPDEGVAAARWGARVRPVLSGLAGRLPVSEVGAVLWSVGDGVSLQFDVGWVEVLVGGVRRVRTMILNRPVAVTLVVVGWQRWGSAWTAELLARPSSHPVVPRVTANDVEEYPWVAQNPGGPSPFTKAVSEEEARLVAVAEELGDEAVGALFDEFARRA